MANELAVMNGGAVAQRQQAAAPMPKIMEDVLLAGDLAKLTPDQRVSFYGSLCQSLGLNPLTKPFEYLNLSGKMVLYAGKACAEQLRFQHSVTTRLTSREVINDIYVVTAKATLPSGREDESTGAVNIKGVTGDALAIAYMKAETKAKRRVTLSICGLGMMDESEVDSVRGASRVHVDMSTGDIDTGGHPVGTQAAATFVGDRKVEELKKKGKSTDFAMLGEFSKMKKGLALVSSGDVEYYRILGMNGFEHANEITDKALAKRIYMQMEARRRELAAAGQQTSDPVSTQPQPAAQMAEAEGAGYVATEEDLPEGAWPAGRD